MEQTVSERPFSQEQQLNQHQTGHNGTVGSTGVQLQEDPSKSWYPKRETGWSRSYMSGESFSGDNLTLHKGQICRDFLRGKCARGTSCKFQHSESDGHDGPRSYVCRDFLQGHCTRGESCKFRHSESDNRFRSYENENLGDVSKPGTSQFDGTKMDNDSRTTSFSRRGRSPCRKFQSGLCLRGAACPYLHTESSSYVRPRYDWSTQLQQGVTTASRIPRFGDGSIDNNRRTPQGNDGANEGNSFSNRSISGEHRGRSPCRNFLRGRCFREASCPYLHPEQSTYVRPEHDGANEGNSISTRSIFGGHRGTSPCRNFLRGRCFREASCPYLHPEQSAYDRPEHDGGNEGNTISTRSISGERRGRSPCRNFLRGRCFREASCPYLHPQHSTFVRPEHDGANEGNSISTRSNSGECRGRSPCRNFLRGRCYREASCPYLHPEHSTYVRPEHDWRAQPHRRVAATSSNPDSAEGSIDVTLRRSQELDEAKKDINLSTRSFPRESRSRSPCRKFLAGRCFREASCPYLHPVTYDRPRYDWSAQQHQGLSSTSRNPVFCERKMDVTSRMSDEYDVVKSHGVAKQCQNIHARSNLSVNNVALYEQNTTWPMKDTSSRNWSSERQRRRPLGDFGGDKLRLEVCLKFTKGRCDRGESCKYLHGFHEYASSIPDLSKQPHFEATAAASRNFGGPHLYAPSSTRQEHDYAKNEHVRSSEHNHAGSSFISRGDSYDENTKKQSVDHTVTPNILDQKGEAIVMDRQKCEISGGAIPRNSDLTEADDDIDLWSRPFKRRRSRSRSPFNPKDNLGCRSIRRHESQNNFPRDRCYNVVPFRYANGSSYQYKRPGYVVNNHYSKADATSADSCFHEVKKGLNMMETQGHDKVMSRGMQLDRCQGDSLHSNTEILNQKSEAEPATGTIHPSYVEQDNEDSKVAATSHEVEKEPDLMKTLGHDKFRSHGMQLDGCPGGSLDSNTAILNQNSEAEPDEGAVQRSHVEQDGERLVTDSSESDISKGDVAVQLETAESDSTSSCENNHSSPMDTDVCVLNKDDNNLSQEGNEKTDEMKKELRTSSRKNRRRRRRSKRCVGPDEGAVQPSHAEQDGERLVTDGRKIDISNGDIAVQLEIAESDSTSSCENNHSSPMDTDVSVLNKDDNNLSQEGNEKTDETKQKLTTSSRRRRRMRKRLAQRLSSSSAGGVSDDVDKSVVKSSSVKNGITIFQPVQQLQQENVVITNKIQNNVQAAENGIMLVDFASQSMQTSDSSSKAANPTSTRKLLILDLNGLLADVVADVPSGYKPDIMVSRKAVFKRPYCDDFLEFCFERFDVGVWSSRMKKNVDKVVDFLMGNTKKRLLFCWDQSHCTKTGYKTIENKEKPLVLKELKKLWGKQVADLPWKRGFYNETNTVLLDDSPYKALRNPPYTAVFPHSYTFKNVYDNSLGPGGDLRLYLERLAAADNIQKFIQENPFGQRPITKASMFWGFYSKIVGVYGRQREENANKPPASSKHPHEANTITQS